MWLAIRWLFDGRRTHPSIGEFKRIRSDKFSEAGAGPHPPGGQPTAPAPASESFFGLIRLDGSDGHLPMGEELIELPTTFS